VLNVLVVVSLVNFTQMANATDVTSWLRYVLSVVVPSHMQRNRKLDIVINTSKKKNVAHTNRQKVVVHVRDQDYLVLIVVRNTRKQLMLPLENQQLMRMFEE